MARPLLCPVLSAAREETLGDRIGERMRSRLFEMCRVMTVNAPDYRQFRQTGSPLESKLSALGQTLTNLTFNLPHFFLPS
jgi:hypothetical protein